MAQMSIGTRPAAPGSRAIRIALATAATICCVFAAVALAAEGQLSFVECLKDTGSASSCNDQGGSVDGLSIAYGVTISADGKSVYVASFDADAVAVFARNPTTGALTYVETQKDGVGGVDGLDGASRVAISADGRSVYAASIVDDAVAVFARNPTTGALTYVETQRDGVGGVDGLNAAAGVSTSADGKSVYAVSQDDDAVAVFARNPSSGALTYVEAQKDGVGGVDGLDGARSVSTSADGKSVYAASYTDDAVAVFARNPTSGALTYVEAQKDGVGGVDGIAGARDVATSPDGKSVYVASQSDDAVAVFARNPTSGALTYVEAQKDGVGGADGLNSARSVITSADGKSVYVASSGDDAVAAFARNPTTGALSYVEMKKDGQGGVDGLSGARGVATSADGKSVYVASFNDNAVAVFSREPDTTAPETTITSGPTGNTTGARPSFGFSSDDPGFTAGFECRVDGGAFFACSSPTTIGPLGLGPHTFAVQATDTAGNTDPSPALRSFAVVGPDSTPGPGTDPDTEVTDPDVSAKKTQKVKKKVKVKVKAGAQEPVDLVGKGRITVKKGKKGGGKKGRAGKSKSFNLKTVRKSTDQGEQTVLRLKPAKKKESKKIIKLLKKGKDLRANPSVKLTDATGNSVIEKRVVRLKLKKGKK